MVKRILVKVALCPYEQMLEEACEVFAELEDVVDFHGGAGLVEGVDIPCEIGAVSVSAEPCGHEGGFLDDEVACERAYGVVDDGEGPLDEGVAAFSSGLLILVLVMVDVVLLADGVQMTVDECFADEEECTEGDAEQEKLVEVTFSNGIEMLRCLVDENFTDEDRADD